MAIPLVSHGEYAYWERIPAARQVDRIVGDRTIKFFVQPTRSDCVYACTVDDVARLLSCLPTADWEGIDAIVLRQPSRKEQALAPVWGRLAYAADFTDPRKRLLYQGAAIVLDAINPQAPLKFGRGLSPTSMTELDRLREDGHEVSNDRDHTVRPNAESCRATQLFRTVLHELGHWVDFLDKVERPSLRASEEGSPDIYEQLLVRFHQRTLIEKEVFAHSYADRIRKHLVKVSAIPFDRQLNQEQLRRDGLRPEVFVLACKKPTVLP